jgi:hypothetical protein
VSYIHIGPDDGVYRFAMVRGKLTAPTYVTPSEILDLKSLDVIQYPLETPPKNEHGFIELVESCYERLVPLGTMLISLPIDLAEDTVIDLLRETSFVKTYSVFNYRDLYTSFHFEGSFLNIRTVTIFKCVKGINV